MKAVIFGATALLGVARADAATVEIRIDHVRNAHGLVHVDLCPQARFLREDCPYIANVPAQAGTTTIVLRNVAPGDYAVQATHDENANHHVDRNFLGIPKEGIGFSRDARIRMGPPRWSDARITVTAAPDQRITLAMRYLL